MSIINAQDTGFVVPFYSYPDLSDPNGQWNTLIAKKRANPSVPIVAVVNMNSGPGANVDSNYVSGIAALVDAGIVVLGYVATGYGRNPMATMQAQVDDYFAWYSKLGGIFFDQMANTSGFEGYYSELLRYVHGKATTKLMAIGNPGIVVPLSYYGTMDVLIIYEGSTWPTSAQIAGWTAQLGKQKWGVIVNNQTLANLSLASISQLHASVGFYYVTDGSSASGANTYGKLSSFI